MLPFQQIIKHDNQGPFNRKLLMFFYEFMGGLQQSAMYQQTLSRHKYAQLNYFTLSHDIHIYLKQRNKRLDTLLYVLQQQWINRPSFYKYYFLKFSFSNDQQIMQQIIITQMTMLQIRKDAYSSIEKSIQARKACLENIIKQAQQLTSEDIYQHLSLFNEYHQQGYSVVRKQKIKTQWMIFCQAIIHYRKLNIISVRQVILWRQGIKNMTTHIRSFKQRIIYYEGHQNYLLQIINSLNPLQKTIISKFINLSINDPFLLAPLMNNQYGKMLTHYLVPTFDDIVQMMDILKVLGQQLYNQVRHLAGKHRIVNRSITSAKSHNHKRNRNKQDRQAIHNKQQDWNKLFNNLISGNKDKVDFLHKNYYVDKNKNRKICSAAPNKIKNYNNIRVQPQLFQSKTAIKIKSRDMNQLIRKNKNYHILTKDQEQNFQQKITNSQITNKLDYKNYQIVNTFQTSVQPLSKKRIINNTNNNTNINKTDRIGSINVQNLKKEIVQQVKLQMQKHIKSFTHKIKINYDHKQKKKNRLDKLSQLIKQTDKEQIQIEKINKIEQLVIESIKSVQNYQQLIKQDNSQSQQKIKQIQIKEDIQISFNCISLNEKDMDILLKKQFKEMSVEYLDLFPYNDSNSLILLCQSSYSIVMKLYQQSKPLGFTFITLNEINQMIRTLSINFLMTYDITIIILALQKLLLYLWFHDPCQQIQFCIQKQLHNVAIIEMVEKLQAYTKQYGFIHIKKTYSNFDQINLVFKRPSNTYQSLNNLIGKSNSNSSIIMLRQQILCSDENVEQIKKPHIIICLQNSINYSLQICQLFRHHLTEGQIILLRQNTYNVSKLKEIFSVIICLDKLSIQLNQMQTYQFQSLKEMNQKFIQNPKTYQYIYPFEDIKVKNRILFSCMNLKLKLPYKINSTFYNQIPYMRIQTKGLINMMISSVNGKDPIYLLPEQNKSHRIIFLSANTFIDTKMQLFNYLKLILHNVIHQISKPFESMWVPQFTLKNKQMYKRIFKITDFSIALNKNMWLGQDSCFCNKTYIHSGLIFSPSYVDSIIQFPFIIAVLNRSFDEKIIGNPIYARLITKQNQPY